MPRRANACRDEIMAFGMAVVTMRERHGWTQRQLAEAIPCAPSTLSRIENGHQGPDWSTLSDLAAAFGVQPSVILSEAGL